VLPWETTEFARRAVNDISEILLSLELNFIVIGHIRSCVPQSGSSVRSGELTQCRWILPAGHLQPMHCVQPNTLVEFLFLNSDIDRQTELDVRMSAPRQSPAP
jgi:hypothetical protein